MHAAILLLFLLTYCGRSNGDWRPVGQGDPLIDPTHVYSPPQVQHVHYWLKAPSLSLEPPPSKVSEISQVAGWPQITTHLYTTTSTTPISITTSKPEITAQTFFRPNYVQNYKLPKISETTRSTTTTTTTTTTEPTTKLTTTTSTTTTPTPIPLSFVIQGHSKVKKYGPLPESSNSIHSINHNHLTSTKLFS